MLLKKKEIKSKRKIKTIISKNKAKITLFRKKDIKQQEKKSKRKIMIFIDFSTLTDYFNSEWEKRGDTADYASKKYLRWLDKKLLKQAKESFKNIKVD